MAERAPAPRRPRKAKPGTGGLTPADCRLEQSEGSAAEATEAVEKAGGCVVGQYKEPRGSHPTLLSILPIDKIEPTPFQRDLSDAHHKRLADVITPVAEAAGVPVRVSDALRLDDHGRREHREQP
jgi:ParB family transcriptional regulator, chromosome partitioning protein